jgi:hypothetical protein
MSSNDKVWYLHVNKEPVGPFTEDEIWTKLDSGEVTYSSFIWKKGLKAWKKIEDESTFDATPEADMPPPPLDELSEKIEPSIWYLNIHKERSGPFTQTEVIDKIRKGVATHVTYVWKKKMKEWVKIPKMTEFKEYFKEEVAPAAASSGPVGSENRQHDRTPLLARIIAHDNQDVEYMPCGNISEGGIFLFSEKPLWNKGTSLKLNIRSDELPEAFNVEGEVVGYSDGAQKGYRIKFVNIPEKFQTMINDFVNSKK